MSVALPTKPDWGELGPAMRALPNDRWRAFVEFYLLETTANGAKNNYGAQANAARKQGGIRRAEDNGPRWNTPRTSQRSSGAQSTLLSLPPR